ncbi:MAG: flagellar hook-basal body complex protein FliE [Halanaerobiaceae bacterium]|nr:flagellar hook-basal body complex protein FliE [Halanaerobiaceae bacterium]
MFRIEGISDNLRLLPTAGEAKKLNEDKQVSFTELLKEKLNEVNELKITADRMTEDFILGRTDNIHQIMIATEKAKLALDLTVAIQNKVVSAYNEIMRMQI